MNAISGTTANRLLQSLPRPLRQRVLAGCDTIELAFGQVLYQAGERVRHVYFPIDGFISLITSLEDGERLEVGIVGDEGMLGVSLVLGVGLSPQHAVVQGAGAALRMSAARFLQHNRNAPALSQRLDRYLYVLMAQLAQTAACTHYHVVESRLARWLLVTRDRAHSDEFRLTQEFLAFMLGVRRAGVTLAAGALQARGLILYERGRIAIVDGAGLEDVSCHCYRQGNSFYDRTMGKSGDRRSVQ
jgi:CRP-like cAMP-binding protein